MLDAMTTGRWAEARRIALEDPRVHLDPLEPGYLVALWSEPSWTYISDNLKVNGDTTLSYAELSSAKFRPLARRPLAVARIERLHTVFVDEQTPEDRANRVLRGIRVEPSTVCLVVEIAGIPRALEVYNDDGRVILEADVDHSPVIVGQPIELRLTTSTGGIRRVEISGSVAL